MRSHDLRSEEVGSEDMQHDGMQHESPGHTGPATPVPHAPPPTHPGGRIDVHELERAWLLLRTAVRRYDRIAREEGWPAPFSPPRLLILVRLEEATSYGLSAGRLARLLEVSPSTLAHHLDALESAGLLTRAPWTVHDRRKVAVRLTPAGRYAVRRLGVQPGVPPIRSPAMASP